MDNSNYGMDAARERMKTKKMRNLAIAGFIMAGVFIAAFVTSSILMDESTSKLDDANKKLALANERLANLDENAVPRINEAYIGERYFCNDQGLTNAIATDFVKNATMQTDQGLETIYRCMLEDGTEQQFHVLATKNGDIFVSTVKND